MKQKIKHYSGIWLMAMMAMSVQAQDPFNAKARKNGHSSHNANTLSLNLHCHSDANIYAEHLEFEQLRLIGVLIEKQQQEALFADTTQQIYSLKVGEYLGREGVKIEKITPQGVELLQWKHSCDKAEKINLKL